MKKKCRIKPPSNRYKNGSVLRGIGAGAYGLAEGIIDTVTFGLTDELTDKGFEGLQNLAKTPEEERRAQEGIKGITNTAGAAGAAIGASILAPGLAPKMFKSAISEGVEGTAGALGATNNEALGMAGEGLTTASNIAMPFINFRYGGGNPRIKEKPSEIFQSVQEVAPINPNWQNEYYHFDKNNARVWKTPKDRFNTFKQDVFPNRYSNVPELRKITTTFKNGGVTPPHTNMYPNGGPGLTGYLGYSTRYPDSPLGGVSYGKQFKANEGYHIPSLEVYGSKYGPGVKGQYTYINPSRREITSPTANVQLGYDPKRRGYVEAGGGVDLNILNDRYNKLYIRPQGGIGINAPSKAVFKTPRMFLDEYINFNYGVGAGYEKTFDNKSKLGVNLRLLMDPVSGKRKESRQDLSLEEAEQIALMDPSIDNENIYKSTNENLKFAPQFEAAVTYTPGLKSKREKNIEKLIAKQNAQKTLDAQSKPQIENYTFMRDDYKYGTNMYANGGYGNNNMNQIPVTQFGNGGSHEENPLGGIPQGMGANGKMNLVEEGELKIPDPRPQSEGGFFIVSADPSMKITKSIAEDYNLPKKLVGKSVLKAAESILRKGTGREGDSIEENSINIDLSNFLDAHEELTAMKESQEQGKFMEELAKLEEKYPEYMQALMGAPEPSMEEMPMDPSMQGMPPQGPSPEEQAMMEQEMMAQQGGMPPGAMPMGAPGMDPAMMGGMPPEAMGMPMMYGGEMYASGGKLPKEVLRARAESHMSKEAADAYVNNYEYGTNMYAKGSNMIKRADGSYSQRGLWDNIRAKAASNKRAGRKGKEPTKGMLEQATKIKGNSKMYGSKMYENGGPSDPENSLPNKNYSTYIPRINNKGKVFGFEIKPKESEFNPAFSGSWDDESSFPVYLNKPRFFGNQEGKKSWKQAMDAYKEDPNQFAKNTSIKRYGSTMGNMYGMGTNMYLLGDDKLTVDKLPLRPPKSLTGGVNGIIGLSEGDKKFDPVNQLSYQKSLGTAALQSLPALANLGMGFFAPPKEYEGALGRQDYVEFPEILPGQNLVDINQNFAGARNALEAVGGTSPGAYMAGVQTLYSEKNKDLNALYTELRNTNATFKAKEQEINRAIQEGNLTAAQAELKLEEAAEAAKAAMLGEGLGQLADIGTANEQNELGLMYANSFADNKNLRFKYEPNPFAGMFNKDQETT